MSPARMLPLRPRRACAVTGERRNPHRIAWTNAHRIADEHGFEVLAIFASAGAYLNCSLKGVTP